MTDVATLEKLYQSLPTGPLDKAILNHLRGINHRRTPTSVPMVNDLPGYVFFTRPQLNMQRDNLRNVRDMAKLISDNPTSIQTFIRCMLDPRLHGGFSARGIKYEADPCPIIDNLNPFVPFLTNSCTSESGWPSIATPTFSSKPGLYNQSFVMVDGRSKLDGNQTLTFNFDNLRGNFVALYFYTLQMYSSYVFEGLLMPYLDAITDNYIDSGMRIYRFRMDYKNQKITLAMAARIAYATGLPIGDFFNGSRNNSIPESNKELSIQFLCSGFDVFDDIILYEFNKCVTQANPMMEDGYRESFMVKLEGHLANSFNWYGYPYVNLDTSDLEWWVTRDTFSRISRGILQGYATTSTSNEIFTGD